MNLKQFVAETLKQTTPSVKKAQSEVAEGAVVNPKIWMAQRSDAAKMKILESNAGKWIHLVDFDVAVSVDETKATKGGLGLFVGPVALGTQGQSSSEDTSVSRLKFQVPIAYSDNEKD